MAKRGTLDHPKIKRLGRAIGMPGWAALGLLEAVWHWVSRYKPDGQLSDSDFEDCADTIRYDDGGLALSSVLHSCGLLDSVGDGVWYIHDWHDHADETTKKALEKAGKCFANGSGNRRYRKDNPANMDGKPQDNECEQFANDSRTPHEQNVTAKPSLAKPSLAKPSRSGRPSIEDAVAYGTSIGLPESECAKYHDWHTSRGWIVGKEPMKDWQAAMRTWKRKWEEYRGPQPAAQAQPQRMSKQEQADRLKYLEEAGAL